MAKVKYFAVAKGRKTGIFTSWSQCEAQIKRFSGAVYKSFETLVDAEAFLASAGQNSSAPAVVQEQPSTNGIIADSISVDAACSGNPGVVEYRGVDTITREVLFQPSPIPQGTNNLGEFLAIVHGLAYLQEQRRNIPIYSDSETAMLWVKNKTVKTTLQCNGRTQEMFELLERALQWLHNNEYKNPILKWDTKRWGEIPADFGRK